VYVETLVLKGSIEEVIVERRKNMSTEEHNKCKSILDDQTMYDWIRNISFQHIPEGEVSGPEQMAKLETPHLVFGRGAGSRGEHDPDADLVFDELDPNTPRSPKKHQTKGKGKKKPAVAFADGESIAAPQEASGSIEP
jgi:hypothetical protein